jgi:hypothetical protein
MYSSKVPQVHLLLLLKLSFIMPFRNFLVIIWEPGDANRFLGLYIFDLDNSVKLGLLFFKNIKYKMIHIKYK